MKHSRFKLILEKEFSFDTLRGTNNRRTLKDVVKCCNTRRYAEIDRLVSKINDDASQHSGIDLGIMNYEELIVVILDRHPPCSRPSELWPAGRSEIA